MPPVPDCLWHRLRPARVRNRALEWLALSPFKANAHLRTMFLFLDLVETPDGPRFELPAVRHTPHCPAYPPAETAEDEEQEGRRRLLDDHT